MRLARSAVAASFALAWFAFWGLAWSRAVLRSPEPTMQLRDRHGAFLGELPAAGEDRLGFWPVEVLPQRVVAATLALEDRRFASHPGVDPFAIARAVRQNLAAGERVSGASTIAMQVARMQDPGPRTLPRKVLEAATALFLVDRHGRDAILAQYLTLAPYGNNVHGIGYAARRYFDKPVEDLSWAEVALLAAVPQAPGHRDLTDPDGRREAVARGRKILDRLLADGVLDEETHGLAVRQIGQGVHVAREPRPEATMHPVLALEGLARARGGPMFATTLDLALQQEVQRILRRSVEAWEDEGAGNAAAVVVDLASMGVLADVGSVGWNEPARAGAFDWSRTRRYPGSTLKPFVTALAMDRGLIGPGTVLDDLERGPDGIGNADGRFMGPMLPRKALANSRNVPAVELVRRVGLEEAWALFAHLGLHDDALPASHYGLAVAIGGMPTTPLALAEAWGTLATDGRLRPLVWASDDERPAGEPIFSPQVAQWTALALSDPMARLPTFPRMGNGELPFPAAFKTGTSPDHRDAWTVAFTRHYLVVVWVGHPDWRPMEGLSGYRAASLLARRILLHLHPDDAAGFADTGFPPPEGWAKATVCPLSGQLAGPRCAGAHSEFFPPSSVPDRECDVHVAEGGHTALRLPPRYAGWVRTMGLPSVSLPGPADGPVALSLLSPPDGAHVTRDPEAPPGWSTIELSVAVDPPVEQVVWLVDGEPWALVGPPYRARWPLAPGSHTFEATLPWRPERSGAVTVLAR